MPKKYKRSANGGGSVSKLSGNRRKPWVVRAPAVEDATGKLHRRLIGCYETRQEALDALAMRRLAPEKTDSSITLMQLWEQWSASAAFRKISASSQTGYRAAWKHLAPIHKYKVVDVKTPQIQFCIDAAEDAGLSYSSMHKIKVLAGRLEKFAMQQDIIDKNYAEYAELPTPEENEKAIFSDLELKKIAEAAEQGVGVADLILLMCYTGWRIAEFCALTRFDYDAAAHTLTGGIKTDAGKNRTVPVPAKVQPYLDAHLAHGQDRIFCYLRGSQWQPYTPAKLRDDFYATMKLLQIVPPDGKKYTPHVTRHTYNSMLYRQGVDDKTRMLLMGHADLETNIKVYTHVDLRQLQAAANLLK